MVGSDESGAGQANAAGLSPSQARGVRGLLGWSTAELAARTGLGEDEIGAFEAGTTETPAGRVEVLRSAFMNAGIRFTGGSAPGVALDGTAAGDEGTRLGDLTTENDR